MKHSKKQLQDAQRRAVESRLCNNTAKQALVVQPDDHRKILCHGGQFALVDVEDYERFVNRSWRLNDSGYAISDQTVKRMHRQIFELIVGRPLNRHEQVDHINGIRNDNRRSNLRLASNQQNGYNRKPRKVTSSYKGVYWYAKAGKWRASIQPDGVKVHCGTFDDEVEAAYMYDQYALQLFGEYAYLNVL